jgi:hypothetical protein
MRRLLPFLLVAAVGCAPVRDEVGGGAANTYASALFTIVDYGDWADYQEARVVLVDADWGCERLSWGGSLSTWELPEGTAWLQAVLYRGMDHDGWAHDFPSQAQWNADGGQWNRSMLWWSGEYGVRGDGNDTPDVPAPGGAPRDTYDTLGVDFDEADDRLDVRDEGPDGGVSGFVDASDGEWSFDAEFCGVFSEVVIGR